MKKLMMIWAMMATIVVSASAMTYSEAQREALFLTDKMAYELNLSNYQYEQVYLINLDYLRYIDRASVYGNYWSLRNRQLADVLTASQYRLYEMANYFYRPVSWSGSHITFNIYTRYANRQHFYRPAMRQTVSKRTGTMQPPRTGVQVGRPATGNVNPRPGNVGQPTTAGQRPGTPGVGQNAGSRSGNGPKAGAQTQQPTRSNNSTGTRTQPTSRGGMSGGTTNANGKFGGQRK